jgi:hypothetical protein
MYRYDHRTVTADRSTQEGLMRLHDTVPYTYFLMSKDFTGVLDKLSHQAHSIADRADAIADGRKGDTADLCNKMLDVLSKSIDPFRKWGPAHEHECAAIHGIDRMKDVYREMMNLGHVYKKLDLVHRQVYMAAKEPPAKAAEVLGQAAIEVSTAHSILKQLHHAWKAYLAMPFVDPGGSTNF